MVLMFRKHNNIMKLQVAGALLHFWILHHCKSCILYWCIYKEKQKKESIISL